MGVVDYYSIDGELTAERAGGGARTDYLQDALGSVTGTSNSAGAAVNTYRHKPYGEQLARSGVGADPKFLWIGTAGYRIIGLAHSSHYVRARHYSQNSGSWTTRDPLWPTESAYVYSDGNVTSLIDPGGLGSCQILECPPDVLIECAAKCKSIGRRYKDCVVAQATGGAKIYNCYCKCPHPVTSRAQAMANGAAELQRKHGKCQKVKTGPRTPAHICPEQDFGGNHETTTYRCKGRVVTVSIVCCECEEGKFTCFPVVKP